MNCGGWRSWVRTRLVLFMVAVGSAALLTLAIAQYQDARATSLVRGWNNISYGGSSRPPADALSSIAGAYNAVYRYDATRQDYDVYAPSAPGFVSNITQLNQGDAIWINVTADAANLSTGSTGVTPSTTSGPGKLSIAASTFQPASDLAIYEKSFNQLNPVGTDEPSKRYYAPVILPQGVTITSMTAAFEATGGDVQVRLDYTPLTNGTVGTSIFKLVEVLSSAGASPQTANAPFAHSVDNGTNVYFLVVDLTNGAATKLKGVSIAYSGG